MNRSWSYCIWVLLVFNALPICSSTYVVLGQDCPEHTASIYVKAFVDGRSELKLQGVSAYWFHRTYMPPGTHGNADEPTYLSGIAPICGDDPSCWDGIAWYPTWNDCLGTDLSDCMSSVFWGAVPFVEAIPGCVGVYPEEARGDLELGLDEVNGIITIEFDDESYPGPEWYLLRVEYPYDLQPVDNLLVEAQNRNIKLLNVNALLPPSNEFTTPDALVAYKGLFEKALVTMKLDGSVVSELEGLPIKYLLDDNQDGLYDAVLPIRFDCVEAEEYTLTLDLILPTGRHYQGSSTYTCPAGKQPATE